MSGTIVDISGLDRAKVLACLYNFAKSRPFRLGCTAMHISGAQAILARGKTRFDRLGWRYLGVDLSGDSFDSSTYDAHNQFESAARIIAHLREAEDFNIEHPPSGACPIIPKPSTRFLQLRLMFGSWYFIGKSPAITNEWAWRK
jgi:hypothetical protein